MSALNKASIQGMRHRGAGGGATGGWGGGYPVFLALG